LCVVTLSSASAPADAFWNTIIVGGVSTNQEATSQARSYGIAWMLAIAAGAPRNEFFLKPEHVTASLAAALTFIAIMISTSSFVRRPRRRYRRQFPMPREARMRATSRPIKQHCPPTRARGGARSGKAVEEPDLLAQAAVTLGPGERTDEVGEGSEVDAGPSFDRLDGSAIGRANGLTCLVQAAPMG
jgi:hypothetical protein